MAIRTYGLSGSGMDIDQLVKDMMAARRTSYDKMWQKKTQAEWKKADYNTMYTAISDFRNSTAFNYKLQGTTISKSVSSTQDSVVKATANSDAANVSHSLNVIQLAEGATLTSAGSISSSSNKESLQTQFGLDPSTSTFDVVLSDGTTSKTIQVDATKSIYEVVSDINKSGLNIKANYDASLDRFFLNTTGSGANVAIDFTGTTSESAKKFINQSLKLANVTTIDADDGKTSTMDLGINAAGKSADDSLANLFNITGNFNLKLTNGNTTVDVLIDSDESLNELIGKINDAGVNASASFDVGTGKFTLKAASESLSVAGSDQATFDFLNDNLKLDIQQNTPTQAGKDALFNLDGVNLSQKSNTFTVAGVTYNLKAEGTANIVVAPDNDKAIRVVKDFVTAYNALLEKVDGEVKESKYSDYTPLTKEQKSEMGESEITEWEKMAKSGMLRRDTILQDVVYKLRSNISNPISGLTGEYRSLSAIGVTTGDYSEGGKLYVDETKLKTALEADPDIVYKLFGSTGETTETQGVATRIYDTLKTSMDNIKIVAGTIGTLDGDTDSTLAKRIREYEDSLYRLNDRLNQMEKRYYSQFDAMESVLNSLTQQNGWLLSQLNQ